MMHADLDLCDISEQHRGDGGEHDRNVSVFILDQSSGLGKAADFK